MKALTAAVVAMAMSFIFSSGALALKGPAVLQLELKEEQVTDRQYEPVAENPDSNKTGDIEAFRAEIAQFAQNQIAEREYYKKTLESAIAASRGRSGNSSKESLLSKLTNERDGEFKKMKDATTQMINNFSADFRNLINNRVLWTLIAIGLSATAGAAVALLCARSIKKSNLESNINMLAVIRNTERNTNAIASVLMTFGNGTREAIEKAIRESGDNSNGGKQEVRMIHGYVS